MSDKSGADVTQDRGCPDEAAWMVLYDGACSFCKWLLSGLLAWDRAGRLHPVALQLPEAAELLRDLAVPERMSSWHLISPNGDRSSGGAALSPLLRLLPGGRLPAAAFDRAPVATERGYRWVADHRSQLSRWVPSNLKRRASLRLQRREESQVTRH